MSNGPTNAAAPVPRTQEKGTFTLAFAGDIRWSSQLRPLLDDPETALAPIRSELAAADLTVANLETAVTTRGEPERKDFTFRAPSSAFEALASAGIDVASMGNNHGVDYGPQGLSDTLAAIKDAPLAGVGIGRDAEQAFAPHVATIRGTRVAVIGATQVDDPTARNFPAGAGRAGVAATVDPQRLVAAVAQARRSSDVVVVFLHWGEELNQCPISEQKDLARMLSDAGADVVVGTHAHVLLGSGMLGRTYVHYGLGNFVWPNQTNEATTTTGVLTLTMKGRTTVATRWSPARIKSDGLPHFAEGDKAEEMREDFADLRSCTGLAPAPEPPA
ncbi:CapA family protein [Actinopolymorpha pittospori]|uniref:Poly-gamma-glutamate synthesis protein (Capsule biosynthesis protein) n=1 Tax=Actinopolymorpha pittospori TaxID=648752 RepID=A0A927N0N9_9ACTN|nr:poly-gamma-glutamate synthesis protein (capsule biosynthesis protein) [Actinopolymorpha pittospori]